MKSEGNFSFAQSLLTNYYLESPENITATSYDSADIVHAKYPDAHTILENLTESGCAVLHSVDGTNLPKVKALKGKRFDFIVFNFPHIGQGIKDQERNIQANQAMLAQFFQSAISFLNPSGEIHVSLKDSYPYTAWNIKLLASRAEMSLRQRVPFLPEIMYPGYVHRRTIGFDDVLSSDANADLKRGPGIVDDHVVNCFTFCFWRTEMARKQATGKNKNGSNSTKRKNFDSNDDSSGDNDDSDKNSGNDSDQ
ncbi:hypothetical protein HK100_004393 [Physocladia obscura]|uniref:25S rRNA (uridine-N(3))-methyltransferase BMT5-like domain-containing protein n=1 Tax=Physocladia obscura TaxID=109957 RepID=A0AAD5SVR6_9FUNG|nr:hypothetical protein HK100_004393 [Physocladia obscura]